MIKNQLVLLLTSLFLLTGLTSCNSQLQASQTNELKPAKQSDDKDRPQPNVVIILADDLGWQDVQLNDIM